MLKINKAYPCHSSNYAVMGNKVNEYIVVHYVGASGGARDNAIYFNKTANIGASAHYFVSHASEGAEIYQSVQDKYRAFHAGDKAMNSKSIGIEMCCHKKSDGTWYFDAVTVDKTVELVKELMKKYNIAIDNVIRHYDVTGKICPEPYVRNPVAWLDFKARVMEVKDMTLEEAKQIIKDKAGLSDNTVQYLLWYKWGDDLVIKLAKALTKG